MIKIKIDSKKKDNNWKEAYKIIMIPYGRQLIEDDDIKAIVDVLKSDYLTTGPKVKEFEEKFASKVGAKYAVAVSNGTAALHLSCMAIGLKKNDEIITSPMTFAASANCALYCGAKPRFTDVDENGLIDPQKISEKINENTKAIIPVDYSGMPCDLKEIKNIAEENNLMVIEDGCHALGAKYNDTSIGDCSFSDLTVFSFHPVKHITTGEGGMITTNSKELYDKLMILRTHGITKDPKFMENKYINPETTGNWYYQMLYLGYNYRITDIQCALGITQLNKLDRFIKQRREIARIYNESFEKLDEFRTLSEDSGKYSAYHLYPILLRDKSLRRKYFDFLRNNKLWVQVHYIPVYLHPYYQERGYSANLCPNAEDFYEREISIPMYPGMTDENIEYVISTIRRAIEEYK